MTPEALALIAAYLMCSETAEMRLLDRVEVETCTSLYMEVKLGFVPDVGVEEYEDMSAAERADINQQGYAGYVAWRAANPYLVEEMEAEARRQLAGTDS